MFIEPCSEGTHRLALYNLHKVYIKIISLIIYNKRKPFYAGRHFSFKNFSEYQQKNSIELMRASNFSEVFV